jgi:hypothetical protein
MPGLCSKVPTLTIKCVFSSIRSQWSTLKQELIQVCNAILSIVLHDWFLNNILTTPSRNSILEMKSLL